MVTHRTTVTTPPLFVSDPDCLGWGFWSLSRNDTLEGRDDLYGGGGRDTLRGGANFDRLYTGDRAQDAEIDCGEDGGLLDDIGAAAAAAVEKTGR